MAASTTQETVIIRVPNVMLETNYIIINWGRARQKKRVIKNAKSLPRLTQRSKVCACASVGVVKRWPKWRCELVGFSCDTQVASQELKTATKASKSVHIFLLRHTVEHVEEMSNSTSSKSNNS